MHIGDEIRRLREELGLTQAELAKDLATASYISQIERGTAIPSRKILQSLAARLGKPTYHFEALTAEADNRELLTKLERLQALIDKRSFEDATNLVSELENEATGLWDAYIQGKWSLCRGYLAWRLDELDDALYYMRRALEHYESCSHVTEVARSLGFLARIHRQRNDLELAGAYTKKAIGVLTETGYETDLLYNLRIQLAVVLSQQGKREEARSIYEMLGKGVASTSYPSHISLLLGLSHTYEQTGQTQLSYEYAIKARILAEQHSDLQMVAVSERVIADGLIRLGEYSEAHVYLDRALERQTRVGPAFEQARILLRKAKAYALEGDELAAEDAIAAALSREETDGPSSLLIRAEAHATQGLLQKARGNLREAASLYVQAGDMFMDGERKQMACENFQEAAELLYRCGDLAQAFTVQQRALDIARQTLPYVGL